jgi:methionine aminotransferase
MDEIKKVHQFVVFSVNSLAQIAINDYLDSVAVAQLGSFYQIKRDCFRNLLAQTRLELLPCEGTYFQTVSYAAVSDLDDLAFARQLTTAFGVAAIPVSVFRADKKDLKHLRFCFAKDEATLAEAGKRLALL